MRPDRLLHRVIHLAPDPLGNHRKHADERHGSIAQHANRLAAVIPGNGSRQIGVCSLQVGEVVFEGQVPELPGVCRQEAVKSKRRAVAGAI
jgi:hypothetical protein